MKKLLHHPCAKAFTVLLCIAALLSVAAACASPTPPPTPVTLRFAFPAADADYFKALADQFTRANPNIKIELVSRRWDALTGIVDPTGVDVLLTSQFGLDDLRNKGTLVSLDALIAGDRALNATDFLPNATKMFVTNGKTWALPAGLDPQVIYYSKDLFDQRKVPYPEAGWNWDNFRETILKLRDPAAGIYGYAVITDYLDPILFVYQHGGRLFDSLEDPTRATFTDPKDGGGGGVVRATGAGAGGGIDAADRPKDRRGQPPKRDPRQSSGDVDRAAVEPRRPHRSGGLADPLGDGAAAS